MNIFKKETAEEIAKRQLILDEHEQSTEELLELLQHVDNTQEDIYEICKDMAETHMKFYYVLRAEDEQIAARDAKVSPAEVAKLKAEAIARLKDYR